MARDGEEDAEASTGTWRGVRAPARPRTLRGALREELRLRHYSERTLKAYDQWVRRGLSESLCMSHILHPFREVVWHDGNGWTRTPRQG